MYTYNGRGYSETNILFTERQHLVYKGEICPRGHREHRQSNSIELYIHYNLRQLHWLPIRQRIQFKVLTLMHGAVHNRTPRYLSDRIVPHAPSRSLRSATKSLVAVPRINLERYGRRSFSCAGPTLWNALPLGLRTQQDPDRFRRDLKTHLFNVASS